MGKMPNIDAQLKFSDSHELLYFIDTRLAGSDPRAVSDVLDEHLRFLADLAADGKLVFAGPLDAITGAPSGHGIYALRTASLGEAQAIVAQDPMHKSGIRVGQVRAWHRKKDWSVLPEPRNHPADQ
jgi:uncharacterized protein YciI